MPLSIEPVGPASDAAVAILVLSGELDASNYETLVEHVRVVHADGARTLVLDLERLGFMASSGLVALYSAVRIMRGEAPPDLEAGWGAIHDMEDDAEGRTSAVRLAAVQPAVDRVLDRTGMKRLFEVDATRDEAVAAARGA